MRRFFAARYGCLPTIRIASVRRILLILVDNALKYSPEDSPLTVSAERKAGKIVIGVADRGEGIEEHERALIFDRFYRGREHRFQTKGTGMGLAIAKGIVEAHGGTIRVKSEPGRGNEIIVTLPSVPAETPPAKGVQ